MTEADKQKILSEAEAHVHHVQGEIKEEITKLEENIKEGEEEWRSQSAEDRVILDNFLAHYTERTQELGQLYPSPYFVRCDLRLEGDAETKPYYFGKFPLSESSIYSWTAPAAQVRFEAPGNVSYQGHDKDIEKGVLTRKDQYLISNGKIVFMATESQEVPRTLIYQEHFSTRKTGFMLPEIVAQMEKAQDQVIRAEHKGPFVISGPAGSGKTTLALHRVAYLMQSPDTATHYPSESVVVFVQDTGTRDYFSHLLPDLGIKHVVITTFAEWALQIVGLRGFKPVARYGGSEQIRDEYEFAKLMCLRRHLELTFLARDSLAWLEAVYSTLFSPGQQALWKEQIKERVLDRFDLTLLLLREQHIRGVLEKEEEQFVRQKNGTYKRKRVRQPVRYNLMVLDEFQNYLPEQLRILLSCQHPTLRSTVFVGDMAQQIHLGTIRQWQESGLTFSEERQVTLQKVYRNTRQTLEYIRSLGYEIVIPEGLRDGPEVVSRITYSYEEEIDYISGLLEQTTTDSIGVLAKDRDYLEPFRRAFCDNKRVFVYSMQEAQGVEFDHVCLVDVNASMLTSVSHDRTLREAKAIINRDLFYVALTRTMLSLHVLGANPFISVLSD